jgi:peroxiredoxin
MVANLLFLTCAFLGFQEPASGQPQNIIHLQRGHELYYRGLFTEEAMNSTVQFRRTYAMDMRALVLDVGAKGFDLAFLTTVKKQNSPGDRREQGVCSVRLELGQVDPTGRITLHNPQDFLIPLDGPNTFETGVFVEFPEGPLKPQQWWRVGEEMRPERTWRYLGIEEVHGFGCIKVEGVQQSDSWAKPRADRPAWRRKDIVWISRKWGIATRIDRTIELREAAHVEATQRCRVFYDLQGPIPYSAQLFEPMKKEIVQALAFAKQAAPLLPNPSKQNPASFDILIAKIVKHIETTPETPYRSAVVLVKQRLEAAKRGESPPERPGAEYAELQPVATPGRIAPDFVVGNLFNKESVRLHNYAGREVFMVFYLPTSSSAEEVLRFAERMHREHKDTLAVLGFALSDNVPQLRAQYEDFHLSFPIATGRSLRQRYGVVATPRLIVIDPDGYVRSAYDGWGPETPTALEGDVLRWLRPESPTKATQPVQLPRLTTRDR